MIGTVSEENSALDLATIPLGLSDHEVFLAIFTSLNVPDKIHAEC